MSENLIIWDLLSKTDPKHVKGFQRAGGFKGHAVRPIYAVHKMTEVYGPAGDGWGTTEPLYQIVPGVNQEVMVYCSVGLWTASKDKLVYGVGGDKVVSYVKANQQYNRPERWENDDEAFKKAYTDALTNAMKHLGMSADVHMGLFDDSKYVQEREREERSTSAIEGRTAPNQTPNMPMQPDHLEAALGPSSGPLKSSAQAKRDNDWPELKAEVDACPDLDALNLLAASPAFVKEARKMPRAWQVQLADYIQTARDEFIKKAGYNFGGEGK